MSPRKPNPRAHRLAYVFVVASITSACVTETPTLGTDDEDMLDRVADYRSFRKINGAPYKSGVKGTVNIWVSPEGADAYAARNPDRADGGPQIPVGTLIVREVLDEQGAVGKLTLMAKWPEGYQPELGDWWFGVTTPDVTPLFGEADWQIGRMPDCHGCHVPHAGDDYLFGVPGDKRL